LREHLPTANACSLVLLKPVVLVGMMGAGKSAVGMALSKRLGVMFRDSDAEIEQAAACSIAEIFARDGETFFRAREAEVIARLLREAPAIISTGGGAYLRPETRNLISGHGVAVWLRADIELLWSRVKHKDTRPLLRTENPKQTLADLLAARTPSYEMADLVAECHPEYSIEAMVDVVIGVLMDAGILTETLG